MNLLTKTFDFYLQGKLKIVFSINTSPKYTNYARKVLETTRPVVYAHENLFGQYQATFINGTKSLSHNGLRIAVVGEFRSYENEVYSQFFCRYSEIQPPSELTQNLGDNFCFENMHFPTATYYGNSIQAVYAIQFQVKKLNTYVVLHETQFYVVDFCPKLPELQKPARNAVGIRNLLHFEIICPKTQYECYETLVGQVYILLSKLTVVSMHITIICQEYYEDDKIRLAQEKVLADYEIMDGSPVKGGAVPFRVFLKNLNISPYLNFKGSLLQSQTFAKIYLYDSNGEKYSRKLNLVFSYTRPDNLAGEEQQNHS